MPEITIKTQCGVETCEGCRWLHKLIHLPLRECRLYITTLEEQGMSFKRCQQCIAEFGKGEKE